MGIRWKIIKGYEKLYLISNDGQVKSLSRILTTTSRNGRLKYHATKENIKKGKVTKYGYHTVQLHKGSHKGKDYFVHRLVAQAFILNPKKKPFVNHKDGNKLNNHVSNLEWVTAKENMQHCNHVHRKKLTLKQAKSIIKMYKTKEVSMKFIAEKYKIGYTTVWQIINKKIWECAHEE